MPAAHSDDLRQRVVAAVAAGSSRHAAAARFQVGVSSAIRWTALEKETGSVSPRRRSGGGRSPLEERAAWLKAAIEEDPFQTLAEIVGRMAAELGVSTSQSAVRRCFQRQGISVKKNRARRRTGSA
jgi:transposase